MLSAREVEKCGLRTERLPPNYNWQEVETFKACSMITEFWKAMTCGAPGQQQQQQHGKGLGGNKRKLQLLRHDMTRAGDDGACCICGGFDSNPGNEILFCDGDGCQVAVHLQCYGVAQQHVPPGDDPWYCYGCAAARKSGVGSNKSAACVCPATLLSTPIACRRCNNAKYRSKRGPGSRKVKRQVSSCVSEWGEEDEDGFSGDEAPARTKERAPATAASKKAEAKAGAKAKMAAATAVAAEVKTREVVVVKAKIDAKATAKAATSARVNAESAPKKATKKRGGAAGGATATEKASTKRLKGGSSESPTASDRSRSGQHGGGKSGAAAAGAEAGAASASTSSMVMASLGDGINERELHVRKSPTPPLMRAFVVSRASRPCCCSPLCFLRAPQSSKTIPLRAWLSGGAGGSAYCRSCEFLLRASFPLSLHSFSLSSDARAGGFYPPSPPPPLQANAAKCHTAHTARGLGEVDGHGWEPHGVHHRTVRVRGVRG